MNSWTLDEIAHGTEASFSIRQYNHSFDFLDFVHPSEVFVYLMFYVQTELLEA